MLVRGAAPAPNFIARKIFHSGLIGTDRHESFGHRGAGYIGSHVVKLLGKPGTKCSHTTIFRQAMTGLFYTVGW